MTSTKCLNVVYVRFRAFDNRFMDGSLVHFPRGCKLLFLEWKL